MHLHSKAKREDAAASFSSPDLTTLTLDGKHAVFGHVVEGTNSLDKLNGVFADQDGRPFKDVRVRHVIILGVYISLAIVGLIHSSKSLDDPFPDPPDLLKPPSSPARPPENSTRIAEDEDPFVTLPEEEEERIRKAKAAAASAFTLEMVGDLPFANVRPPENVLFVCKLNPVTRDEDLELIFSRFETIMSCRVIRDNGQAIHYSMLLLNSTRGRTQSRYVSSVHDGAKVSNKQYLLD